MRDQFVERLSQLAECDPRIVLITGDLGFGVLDEFRQRFPRQFINAGVAEQNMMGIATGMALEGHVVFTYSIANFVFMRCLEQIRNDAAYHNCNVNVVCIGGGFSYGPLGISHHATEDLAVMRALPGVSVISPCDLWEAAEATEAIARTSGVSYLRLDKSAAEVEPEPHERFRLGTARQIREGQDVTLMVTGGIATEALAAAERLSDLGIRARVVSLHTIKPLDANCIRAAAEETEGIVTIEEHSVYGGLGSAVAETLLDHGVQPRGFARVALRDGFSSIVGSQQYLRQRYGLDAEAITRVTLEVIQQARGTTSQRFAA